MTTVEHDRMNWMQALASHYERRRRERPGQPLAIVFDIDGTLMDGRYLLLDMLRAFDRAHDTQCAAGLTAEQLNVHESRLPRLLEQLGEPPERQRAIAAFHQRFRWSTEALLRAYAPYHGVLEVIRWFQLQPNTVVALNTGRPEALRLETLQCLNQLGARFRVRFPSELVYMNPRADGTEVASAKVEGIRELRDAGYGIAAVVDNEPDNLARICGAHDDEDILPLHATTVFRSKRLHSPRGTVRGNVYDITALISAHRLPRHVQLVWDGIGSDGELHRFLASGVRWASVGACPDSTAAAAARNDTARLMDRLIEHGRRVRIAVPGPQAVGWLVATARALGLPPHALWLSMRIEDHGESGIARLARELPGAVVEVDAGFILPMATGLPAQAAATVERLQQIGVNRFGLPWQPAALPSALDLFDRLQAPVHITALPDLQAFLRASLLQPRSMAARFDFSEWSAAARPRPVPASAFRG